MRGQHSAGHGWHSTAFHRVITNKLKTWLGVEAPGAAPRRSTSADQHEYHPTEVLGGTPAMSPNLPAPPCSQELGMVPQGAVARGAHLQ